MSSDDVLRYAFSQAPGRDFVASLATPGRPLTTSFGSRPEGTATDRLCRLIWGTTDLLEDMSYPAPGPVRHLAAEARIQHALVMAFGLQRREPSNLFNDHRSCASVRSRFPVHAFVHTPEQAWFLDVYRHGLLPIGDASPGWPTGGPLAIALAGRYTHLPSLYGRLRGPLVELELGISLRSLCVALDVFGLGFEVQLPGPEAGQLMARLALDPAAEWSAPLNLTVSRPDAAPVPPCEPGPGPTVARHLPRPEADPTLDEVVAVNRTALDVTAVQPGPDSRGPAAALPQGVTGPDGPGLKMSWSEVLWRRSAGRMPRRLAGVAGRRQEVATGAVTEALAWLAAPPPTPLLQEIARHITVSACIQDTAGFATGWYRLSRSDLELVQPDPTLPARLEACYGHGLGTEVGCAVRHANMVWLLSADVPALVEAFGPGAWTLAQYACGWMAHGLCLAAAARGLYARPNRAFDEILLHPVIGMRPGEIVLLSIVSGVSRFREPMLDLRT